MKKLMQIALGSMLLISYSSFAKNQTGIYLSATDYANKKLAYADGAKIHLNNSVWEMPYITVNDKGKKVKLEKKNIYGYVNDQKEVVRIYNGSEYLLAEDGSIQIYIQTNHVAKSKGFNVIKSYYFSKSAESEILPLTKENLKKAFSTNAAFLALLGDPGLDLSGYNDTLHTYQLNYLLSKSK